MKAVTIEDIKGHALYGKIAALHEKMPGKIFGTEELCSGIDGLRYEVVKLPRDISGAIRKVGVDRYVIEVNEDDPGTRRRFTAAHELAHYILHKKEVDLLGNLFREDRLLRGGLSNRQETQANQLAAEILMPYDAVFEFLQRRKRATIPEMADYFKVSLSAMMIRLGIPL